VGPHDRALLQPLVRRGEIIGSQSAQAARERHRQAIAELPGYALQLSRGYPAISTVFGPDGE
jgi:nicotinate phosphoribosyltransferase